MTSQRPPSLDPQAAHRWHHLPADASPWLHEEVARRMEERLGWITLKPQRWAHWAPLRGGMQAHELLLKRYPEAACWMVEPEGDLAGQAARAVAKPWWRPARWLGTRTQFGVPADGEVQMLWANMSLHMAADPQALMAQWQRAVAVDGFIMFSCLGPDTLRELRALYAEQGWPAPSHEFTDMHDWGDMLAGAGFAEPVMDMERITLTFETPQRLLQELRGLGRNLSVQRFAGLRGRQWHERLVQAVAAQPLQITFEVIYGHAFKPAPKLTIRPETVVSLDEMRKSLHQRKP